MNQKRQKKTIIDRFTLSERIRHLLVRVEESGKTDRIVWVIMLDNNVVSKEERTEEEFNKEKDRYRSLGRLVPMINSPERFRVTILDQFSAMFSDGGFRFLYINKRDNENGLSKFWFIKAEEMGSKLKVVYKEEVPNRDKYTKLKRQLKTIRRPIVRVSDTPNHKFNVCGCGHTNSKWDIDKDQYVCTKCGRIVLGLNGDYLDNLIATSYPQVV
jgi:hypothetical protein